MPPQPGEITQMLRRARNADDREARGRLYELVEEELRLAARRLLLRMGREPLLQTTDLIDRAYQQLVLEQPEIDWADRRHFFGVATRVMRSRRIDMARKRKRQQTLDTEGYVPDQHQPAVEADLENEELLLKLDEALRDLEDRDPEAAEAFQLRYFGSLVVSLVPLAAGPGGAPMPALPASSKAMTFKDLAEILQTSQPTAYRLYQRAVEGLQKRLGSFDPEQSGGMAS